MLVCSAKVNLTLRMSNLLFQNDAESFLLFLKGGVDLDRCCEGIFLHQGNNSGITYYSCLTGLFVWLSSLVHSFFSKMYQAVDLFAPELSDICRFYFSLMIVCFYIDLFGSHVENSYGHF